MSALPKSSLVLVTGANGWIASHVVDQLLQAGFTARGTSRDASKAEWLQEYVAEKYGNGKFEVAIVPDMSVEGAFDDAVKGVSAFIHVASDLSFSSDPKVVIPTTLNGVKIALKAAASEPSMKHFVYTSSSAAITLPKSDIEFTIKPDMYNEEAIKAAWEAPADDPMKPAFVYAASKAEAEKAVWEFAKTQDRLVVNSVVPNMNWGRLLSPEGQTRPSSGALIPAIYQHGIEGAGMFKDFPPQYHIDVQDDARLHVAPLLDSSIKNERLFGFNEVYDWEKVLKILHELRPEWKNEDVWVEKRQDLSVVEPRPRTEEILRKVFGRPGLTSMRDSIEANIAHLK